MLPFVTRYLREHRCIADGRVQKHSPLFPILIIVRSLQYSDKAAQVQGPLKEAVTPFLGSQEWQVTLLSEGSNSRTDESPGEGSRCPGAFLPDVPIGSSRLRRQSDLFSPK
jgi:hypothetical protein